MTRYWLSVLMLLSLSACGSLPSRDASPASDLVVLRAAIESELPPRPLSNGRLYCVELAVTQAEADACAVELEENAYLREQDRQRALALLSRGLKRIEMRCGFWARLVRSKACDPKIPL